MKCLLVSDLDKGKYTHEIMYSVLNDEADKISNSLTEAPELLDEILQCALNRDLDKRYQSVSDMLNDLLLLRQRWSTANSVILKKGRGNTSTPLSLSTSGATNWDKSVLNTITRELMKYLGPMASVMVKKKSREASSMKALCYELAEQLPDEQERQRFFYRIKYRDLIENSNSSFSTVAQPGPVTNKSNDKNAEELFPADSIKKIEVALTSIIGPIAGKIVKRATKKTHNLQALCLYLADQLNEKNEKDLFIKKVNMLY